MAGLGFEHAAGSSAAANAAFKKQLNKVYGWYTGGFIAFIIVLAILEQRAGDEAQQLRLQFGEAEAA